MGNRHLLKIALACLGMIIIVSLQGSPRITQVLGSLETTRNPAHAVQAFFKAVERGDWLSARALTTREYWTELEKQGQVETWQNSLQRDNSLEFAGFTVISSQIQPEKAVIDGRAVWVSALGSIPRNTQTITLEKGLGGWFISSIQTKESTGVVESFYLALNEGQWDQAKALVQPDTWRKWESQGIISRLKAGYGKKSPFVTAIVNNAAEEGISSQVQVDLVWMSPQETKVKTTIKLNKSGDKWVIRQIEGGWPKQ